MKGNHPTLILGVLLLFAAAQPQVAHAQPYCFTDDAGFQWNISVDASTDTFDGAVDVFDPGGLWFIQGGRGTNNRTIRAHVLTAINGDLASEVGCGDGEGYVDYFTYNGLIAPAGGGTFSYSGDWRNACGFEGTFTGTIVPGTCPAPRPGPPPAVSPATMVAPSAEAGLRTSPEGYAVSSHPNPFDSGTIIAYEIPEAQHVRLAVYDVLGREVALLVDEPREAGTHTVPWEAASLPAGTYLYRIVAGTYTEAKQLVLAR